MGREESFGIQFSKTASTNEKFAFFCLLKTTTKERGSLRTLSYIQFYFCKDQTFPRFEVSLFRCTVPSLCIMVASICIILVNNLAQSSDSHVHSPQ